MAENTEPDDLAQHLNALKIAHQGDSDRTSAENKDSIDESGRSNRVLVLDAGYGFPREKKVRKEKINAISSQLSNFLVWQTEESTAASTRECRYALVRVVGCPDENTRKVLENRTIENMKRASSLSQASKVNGNNLPPHVTISCETLEQCLEDIVATHPDTSSREISNENINEPVYLSPDAAESLDPCSEPPEIAIVGLLIDRRVQPNRSRDRAQNIGIVARRWPLEDCFAEIDSHEPLNVDCVLEGMQQWWWNWKDTYTTSGDAVKRETFIQAASQAIEHHVKRHPSRPLHIDKNH